MTYYTGNVGGTLHRGRSRSDPLPAYLDDIYDELPLTGSVKLPTSSLTTKFFNVTNDSNRRALAGNKGDKEVTGNFVRDPDEPLHQQFRMDANTAGGVKSNWFVNYPTGEREYFQGIITNYDPAAFEAGEEAVEHRVDWTVTVDEAVPMQYAAGSS